jgi:Ca2+-binding RTX toxin-like protein
VLPDGKILLGGQSNLEGNGDFAAVRVNADGSLDTTFGALDDGVSHLDGSKGDNVLLGGTGADVISGRSGDDLIDGGAGRDILTGGAGADLFRFASTDDSYRATSESYADRIRDFTPGEDRLDLSAMGFTGLGDGRGDTLVLVANPDGTRTYLKSFETDGQGRRFEVSFNGDLTSTLEADDLVFAQASEASAPGLLGAAFDELAV